jgi:hypothetical protein
MSDTKLNNPKKGPRKAPPKPERTASEPLHVMLTPEQMERYKTVQRGLGLSMRDLVTIALDQFVEQANSPDLIKRGLVDAAAEHYAAKQLDAGIGSGRPEYDSLLRMLLALSERIRRLEAWRAQQSP